MHRINRWTRPQSPPSLIEGHIDIWLIEVEQAGDGATTLLSPDEQERWGLIVQDADRWHFANTRSSVRRILSGYLHIAPQDIRFEYQGKGKPVVGRPHTPLEFNLSHSAGMALLVVGQDLPLGVDLEQMQSRANLHRIARKVFDSDCYRQVSQLVEEEFVKAFYLNWTALEARVKTTARGVFTRHHQTETLDHLNFEPIPGWCAAVATLGKLPAPDRWRTFRFT